MGFLDSMKNAAAKATFEADRMVRLNRVETAIGSLRKGLEGHYTELGRAAYQSYRQNRLSDPLLVTVCGQIAALEKELAAKEAEAASIRAEAAAISTPPSPLFGHVCVKCRLSLPPEAAFCPRCGGEAVDILPPTIATRPCPSCGAAIPAKAQFCSECGNKLKSEIGEQPGLPVPSTAVGAGVASESISGASLSQTPEVEEPRWASAPQPTQVAAKTCPSCASQLPAAASFCNVCGRAVSG